jgi:hypothetical protein
LQKDCKNLSTVTQNHGGELVRDQSTKVLQTRQSALHMNADGTMVTFSSAARCDVDMA